MAVAGRESGDRGPLLHFHPTAAVGCGDSGLVGRPGPELNPPDFTILPGAHNEPCVPDERLNQTQDDQTQDTREQKIPTKSSTDQDGSARMSTHHGDGLDRDGYTEVPEADAAEQATPVVPEDDILGAAPTIDPLLEADPADAWEQNLPVPGADDDDYDHDEEPLR